jgi:hypothetical protein
MAKAITIYYLLLMAMLLPMLSLPGSKLGLEDRYRSPAVAHQRDHSPTTLRLLVRAMKYLYNRRTFCQLHNVILNPMDLISLGKVILIKIQAAFMKARRWQLLRTQQDSRAPHVLKHLQSDIN